MDQNQNSNQRYVRRKTWINIVQRQFLQIQSTDGYSWSSIQRQEWKVAIQILLPNSECIWACHSHRWGQTKHESRDPNRRSCEQKVDDQNMQRSLSSMGRNQLLHRHHAREGAVFWIRSETYGHQWSSKDLVLQETWPDYRWAQYQSWLNNESLW